mmetsp:Transcript_49586/g.124330  ORF Transcript_49586/g.124330 Transcript_49586/m.124330 type:complete len:203 (+) Transcript_49586:161-769(+)
MYNNTKAAERPSPPLPMRQSRPFDFVLSIAVLVLAICGGELSDDLAGHSHSHAVWRNALGHHTARAYHRVSADRDAGHDAHAAADPHIVLNGDGLTILELVFALLWVKRVACCVDVHARTELDKRADLHGRHVKNDRVVVHIHIPAKLRVEAIVHPERRLDEAPLTDSPEQHPQEGHVGRGAHVSRSAVVVGLTDDLGFSEA